MNNIDATEKLCEMIEHIEKDRNEPIEFEILEIDRELVIHVEFPTKIDLYNIVFPRKFFKEIKEKIGLELLSFELISPDKDALRRIDYLDNRWVPFPCIEIVFENPDVKEEEIEKLFVTQFGEQLSINE